MVLMIASDLHGSAFWTKQLLDAFRKEKADKLLLLGDLLFGDLIEPDSDHNLPGVADQLNAIADRIIAVRGNCDNEEDQMLLEFPMMADHVLLDVNGLHLYAIHGHLWRRNTMPEMGKDSVLVYGHTHIPACELHEPWLSVNPGSAAFPRGESARSYVIVHDRTFTWKTVEGTAYQDYTVD